MSVEVPVCGHSTDWLTVWFVGVVWQIALNSALSASIINGWYLMFTQPRVQTSLKLYPILGMEFLYMEIPRRLADQDWWLFGSHAGLWTLMGAIVPFYVGFRLECMVRSCVGRP